MHVHRLILVGALGCLVGCGFHSNNAKDASIAIDAAPDAPPDAPPCVPWNALNVMPCDTALGDPHDLTLLVGAYTLETDSGQLSDALTQTQLLPSALIAQASGLMLRVVNVGQLSIANGVMVSVTGTHPLVFVVHGNATIAGTIDVSARADANMSTAGPGADDASACTGGLGASGTDGTGTGGGGGAGGGGFGDKGGDGGDGNGSGNAVHGAHGNATGDTTLVPLRGGCAGGHGGAGTVVAGGTMMSGPGGRAGNGGGALEVTAGGVIDVSGTLKAAGSGGGPPPFTMLVNGGGAAGGSGGAILLDGDSIHVEVSGRLCANGGGGGEGGQGGAQSAFGEDGTCSATAAGSGGKIQMDGGNGGAGGRLGPPNGATTGQPGLAGSSGAGGGGGGGSVGRIRVRERKTNTTGTIDIGAIVSPAAVP